MSYADRSASPWHRLMPERIGSVHLAQLRQGLLEEALVGRSLELQRRNRVRFHAGFDGALPALKTDRELDLILERRKRGNARQIVQQSAKGLLELE
jgi:hypothetical protein